MRQHPARPELAFKALVVDEAVDFFQNRLQMLGELQVVVFSAFVRKDFKDHGKHRLFLSDWFRLGSTPAGLRGNAVRADRVLAQSKKPSSRFLLRRVAIGSGAGSSIANIELRGASCGQLALPVLVSADGFDGDRS